MPIQELRSVQSRQHRRGVAWLRTLWGRISLTVFLIVVVGGFLYLWPRRGACLIRAAGGTVYSDEDFAFAERWRRPAFQRHIIWLSYLRADEGLNAVDISQIPSGNITCSIVRHFPNVKYLTVNGRQLDQSVDELQGDFEKLEWVTVHSAGDQPLSRLARFPKLRFIQLCNPTANDLGIDLLQYLEQIQIHDCADTANLLLQIDRLPHVQRLHFQRCTGFSDEDLKLLSGLESLKFLQFDECSPIGDVGLRHLSRLESLKWLSLPMSLAEISDDGLKAFSRFKSLTSLNLPKSGLNSAQIKVLTESLPGCRLNVD